MTAPGMTCEFAYISKGHIFGEFGRELAWLNGTEGCVEGHENDRLFFLLKN